MDIVIHTNTHQPHQVRTAEYFRNGILKHGLKAEITSNINQEADIHIVNGPHYAKDRWLGHKTILIDRCYYKGDPDHVSIGWMRSDGGRDFTQGSGKQSPIPLKTKQGNRSIFLADYNGPVDQADTIRYHPMQKNSRESLRDALLRHDIAIGYQTTSLVTAALQGLRIDCRDKRNIMSETNWLELLPYADWHYSEIESGELWEQLQR